MDCVSPSLSIPGPSILWSWGPQINLDVWSLSLGLFLSPSAISCLLFLSAGTWAQHQGGFGWAWVTPSLNYTTACGVGPEDLNSSVYFHMHVAFTQAPSGDASTYKKGRAPHKQDITKALKRLTGKVFTIRREWHMPLVRNMSYRPQHGVRGAACYLATGSWHWVPYLPTLKCTGKESPMPLGGSWDWLASQPTNQWAPALGRESQKIGCRAMEKHGKHQLPTSTWSSTYVHTQYDSGTHMYHTCTHTPQMFM